ncbi:MAG TPA: GNAT family N-acetyltransferase [Longimicrobium sp.]|nr:GNAT family N-acetyltransferase [Longimicrobium sp.]
MQTASHAPAATIRSARVDDAAALASLATHLGYPADEAAMRPRIERIAALDDYETYVAERGGVVIGFIGVTWKWSYTDDTPRAQILALVVDPAERGRGTGAALVAAAEEWGRQHGAGGIFVTTALHRERTHLFYERLGYAKTGFRYVKKLFQGG